MNALFRLAIGNSLWWHGLALPPILPGSLSTLRRLSIALDLPPTSNDDDDHVRRPPDARRNIPDEQNLRELLRAMPHLLGFDLLSEKKFSHDIYTRTIAVNCWRLTRLNLQCLVLTKVDLCIVCGIITLDSLLCTLQSTDCNSTTMSCLAALLNLCDLSLGFDGKSHRSQDIILLPEMPKLTSLDLATWSCDSVDCSNIRAQLPRLAELRLPYRFWHDITMVARRGDSVARYLDGLSFLKHFHCSTTLKVLHVDRGRFEFIDFWLEKWTRTALWERILVPFLDRMPNVNGIRYRLESADDILIDRMPPAIFALCFARGGQCCPSVLPTLA